VDEGELVHTLRQLEGDGVADDPVEEDDAAADDLDFTRDQAVGLAGADVQPEAVEVVGVEPADGVDVVQVVDDDPPGQVHLLEAGNCGGTGEAVHGFFLRYAVSILEFPPQGIIHSNTIL